MKRTLLTLLAASAMLFALGCSSDDSKPSFTTAPLDSTSMDATGGTLTVQSGALENASVTFPAGAVGADTTVSVASGPSQYVNPDSLEQASPTMRVDARAANGTSLEDFAANPLTIELPYDPDKIDIDNDQAFLISSANNGTNPTSIAFNQVAGENRVSFNTPHLSLFYLMRRRSAAALTLISAASPSSGTTAGGNTITILGRGFVNPVSVTIGGVTAADATAVNSQRITCTVPAGSAGAADIFVTGAIGDASRSMGYTYVAPTSTGGGGGTTAGSWTTTHMTQPSARNRYGFAGGYIFGGSGGTMAMDDFWKINTNSFDTSTPFLSATEISASGKPAGRERPTMTTFYNTATTSTHVVVWGGLDALGMVMGDGAYFDTVAQTWTSMTMTDAPSARHGNLFWVDKNASDESLLCIWGGRNDAGDRLNDGAVYNFTSNTWTAMSNTGAPSGRFGMGFGMDSTNRKGYLFGGFDGDDSNDLYSYDIANDTWALIDDATGPTPSPRRGMAFSERAGQDRFLIWGGESTANGVEGDGAIYDPVSNAWTALPSAGAPSARQSMGFSSGGAGFMIFGGFDASATPLGGGYMWNWFTSEWVTAPATDAPSDRAEASVLYIGDFFVWGGRDGSGPLNDGGVFDPDN